MNWKIIPVSGDPGHYDLWSVPANGTARIEVPSVTLQWIETFSLGMDAAVIENLDGADVRALRTVLYHTIKQEDLPS